MRHILIAAALVCATPAVADAYERVADKSMFLGLVTGKTLSNRLHGVSLNVGGNGDISGGALGWDITGDWTWQDGYFCRDMSWGGDSIGYNCQMVEVRGGNEMRFTSDQGTGDAASFKLR